VSAGGVSGKAGTIKVLLSPRPSPGMTATAEQ
jgi:hypothetical protein